LRPHEAIWQLAPALGDVLFHGLRYTSDGAPAYADEWTRVRDRLAPALKSGRITSLGLIDAEVDRKTMPDDWGSTWTRRA